MKNNSICNVLNQNAANIVIAVTSHFDEKYVHVQIHSRTFASLLVVSKPADT